MTLGRSTVDRVVDSLRFTLADGVHEVNHPGKGLQQATSYIAGRAGTGGEKGIVRTHRCEKEKKVLCACFQRCNVECRFE